MTRSSKIQVGKQVMEREPKVSFPTPLETIRLRKSQRQEKSFSGRKLLDKKSKEIIQTSIFQDGLSTLPMPESLASNKELFSNISEP